MACDGEGKRTTPRGLEYKCKTCSGEGTIDCPPECTSCEGSGEITEALQQKVREKYSVRFANMTPLTKVTGAILTLNIIVFFVEKMPVGESTIGWTYLVCSLDTLKNMELWRLVTPIFFHHDIWHLGLNCWFLWAYAPILEGMVGSRRFALFYLASGILAEIVSVFGNSGWGGIGASGALFGVAAAFIALHQRYGFFRAEEVRRWAYFAGAYVIAGFALDAAGVSWWHIDNWAHLGGFVAGFALAWLGPKPTGR